MGDEAHTDKPNNKKRKKQVSSTVPLKLPRTIGSASSLLLTEFPDSQLKFSGETGIVGRIRTLRNQDLIIDVKGKIFKGHPTLSNTALVISIGADQAKIESVTNCFVPLKETSVNFQAEKVLEGNEEYAKYNDRNNSDEDNDVNED
jgi:hypothetical protein